MINKNQLKIYINERLGNLYVWEDGLFSRFLRYFGVFAIDILFNFVGERGSVFYKFATLDIELQSIIIGVITLGFLIAESYVQNKYKSTKNSMWMLLVNSIFILNIGVVLLHMSECFLLRLSLPAYYYYGEVLVVACCLLFPNIMQIIRIRKEEYSKLLYNPMRMGISVGVGPVVGWFIAHKVESSLEKSGGFVLMGVVCLIGSLMAVWHTGGFLKFYYAMKYDIEVKRRVR